MKMREKTARIYGLDSLRAVMMLMGVVLHTCVTYGAIETPWPIKDEGATSFVNDFFAFLIHSFRMSTFFLVAGFFGAMLFYERSVLEMVKNRVKRVLYPFVVFMIVLVPLSTASFNYTMEVFTGVEDAYEVFLNKLNITGIVTFHLWFLYYLILVTFVSVIFGLVMKKMPNVTSKIIFLTTKLLKNVFVRVIVFSLLVYLILTISGVEDVKTPRSLAIDFGVFFYYLYFYIAGWVFFKIPNVLEVLKKNDWLCTISGFVIVVFQLLLHSSLSTEVHVVLNSVKVWLFVFGFVGLFMRYGNKYSSIMRYISDSSYWVYLVHLPLVVIIPAFIYHWNVPSGIKVLIVLTGSTTISMVSYHFLVRATFIGQFLNGKKYALSKKKVNVDGMELQHVK